MTSTQQNSLPTNLISPRQVSPGQSLSIVVVCRNGYQAVHKFLNSLTYQSQQKQLEIIALYPETDHEYQKYFSRRAASVELQVKTVAYKQAEYLEVLNKSIAETESEIILVTTDQYLLGKNFWQASDAELGHRPGSNWIMHPGLLISYGAKAYLKDFTHFNQIKHPQTWAHILFEQHVFEDWILAPRKLFTKTTFTNPYKNEFGQFYVDAFANGIELKILSEQVIFKRIPNWKELNARMPLNEFCFGTSQILLKNQLFNVNQTAGLNIADSKAAVQVKRELARLDFIWSKDKEQLGFKKVAKAAQGGGKGIKALVKNYFNNISTLYSNIHKLPEYQYLIGEWKAVNEIEPLLFPERFLIENLEIFQWRRPSLFKIYKEIQFNYNPQTRYLFLVPAVTIGGGNKVLRNYIKALLTKYVPAQITVMTTESGDFAGTGEAAHNDFSLISDLRVNLIALNELRQGLTDEDAQLLLLRLIIQNQPYAVHNINSELGYKFFQEYAKELSGEQQIKLYLTFFMPNVSLEGKTTGHMLEYLPSCYQYLTAISVDNETVIARMVDFYGLDRSNFFVHYQPLENISDDQRKLILERHKDYLQKKAANQIKILWASRVDYQKNIPLLIKIAKHFQTELDSHFLSPTDLQVSFTVAGSVEKNSEADLAELLKLKNVKYTGKFHNLNELEISDFDAFLYTSRSDGLPTIILEIMSLGVIPVLGPAVGAIPEILAADRGIVFNTAEDVYIIITNLGQGNSVSTHRSLQTYVDNAYEHVRAVHNEKTFHETLNNFPGYF